MTFIHLSAQNLAILRISVTNLHQIKANIFAHITENWKCVYIICFNTRTFSTSEGYLWDVVIHYHMCKGKQWSSHSLNDDWIIRIPKGAFCDHNNRVTMRHYETHISDMILDPKTKKQNQKKKKKKSKPKQTNKQKRKTTPTL